jgi:iron complex outermembrane receptor protein
MNRLATTTHIACLFVLFMLAANGLYAQEQPDTALYYMGPVLSIGTRTAEPWVKVPLSLSHITQENLPKGKGYGLDEALSAIPGVLVQSRFGNQDVRITIRGFGARGAGERSNAGTSRGVRILTNGIPETEPDGRTSFDLVDISGAGSIEVMRSNASSVYGNASGGVINVLSNTTFASPFASFTEGFGSFGFRKEQLNAGATLGSGKMYFSLSNRISDGWRWHSQSSQALLTTGIVGQIGERTSVGLHIAATTNIFRIPGPLSQAQYDANAEKADSLYIQRDERRFNRVGRIGVTATHSFDDKNSLSVTAFAQPKFISRSERNTYRDFNRYHIGGSALYSNTASFGENLENKLLLGADEAYQDGAILFYNLLNQGRGTLRDNKREGANNLGFFLQDEISIGEHFLVLVGARYDDISYYSEGYLDPVEDRLSETRSFEKLTPKAGIAYRFSPTHSVYANYGGGIEVPAGNETDPSGSVPGDTINAINPLLEPIRSKTIEVGTKQIISCEEGGLISQIVYDVAGYWLEVTDDIIPYRNGRFYFTAGRTQRMGVEASGSVRMNMGLSVNVALTLSDNKYKEYVVDSLHYGNPGRSANYAENKVVGLPDMYFNIGLKYAPPSLMGAFVNVNVQNVGKYYADDANKVSVPAYTILNAGIGLDRMNFAGDLMYVSFFAGINNITDAKYVGSAWLNPDYIGGVPVFIEPGLPRNVIGSLSLGINL